MSIDLTTLTPGQVALITAMATLLAAFTGGMFAMAVAWINGRARRRIHRDNALREFRLNTLKPVLLSLDELPIRIINYRLALLKGIPPKIPEPDPLVMGFDRIGYLSFATNELVTRGILGCIQLHIDALRLANDQTTPQTEVLQELDKLKYPATELAAYTRMEIESLIYGHSDPWLVRRFQHLRRHIYTKLRPGKAVRRSAQNPT